MQATFERVSLAGRAALTEPLSVLTPDHTLITGSDRSVVEVMSYFVDTYPVDTREGRCTCPDHEHRNARCEYLRRTAVGLGPEPVAAAVLDAVDVDDDLGVNAPGPRVAAADGKPGVIDAGDDADILTDADAVDETDDSGEPGKGDDGRPDDRCCWDDTGERPCWPCYRDGFRETNPRRARGGRRCVTAATPTARASRPGMSMRSSPTAAPITGVTGTATLTAREARTCPSVRSTGGLR